MKQINPVNAIKNGQTTFDLSFNPFPPPVFSGVSNTTATNIMAWITLKDSGIKTFKVIHEGDNW